MKTHRTGRTTFRPPKHAGCYDPNTVEIEADYYYWLSVLRPFSVELRLNGLPQLKMLDVNDDNYCEDYPVGIRVTMEIQCNRHEGDIFRYDAIVVDLPNGDEFSPVSRDWNELP